MFKVVKNDTGEIVTVYGVDDCRFLIYDSSRRAWRWLAMGGFRPMEVVNGT